MYKMYKKTLKEIYNEEYEQNPEFNLQTWYNKILDKTPAELTVDDLCILLRQQFFLDTIMPVALSYLIDNPLEGSLFEGEMIEAIDSLEASDLKKYKTVLKGIVKDGYSVSEKFEWNDAEDKSDYETILDHLSLIL